MAQPPPNGLSNRPELTQSSLLKAIASSVAANRNGYSDQDMADAWGVSSSTVNNAQNKRHDLALMNWLKLGKSFGYQALNPVLALLGIKAAPDDYVVLDVAAIPCEVAKTLPLLIELLADGDCSNADVRVLDQAGAIDALGKVSDMLRQRRDGKPLAVVGER